MTSQVHRPHGVLIHQKDNLAPRVGKTRPVAREYGFIERSVVTTHVIRSDHLIGRENRTDLRIKSIEGTRRERLRLRYMKFAAGFPLLGLDQDKDRHMIGMSARPLPHLLQTSRQR